MGTQTQEQPSQFPANGSQPKTKKKVLNRIVENRMIDRLSYKEYRDRVREVYDGTQGSFLYACSTISLHAPLGERLFRHRKFDLRGARRILDVGSGAGQIAGHLLKYADPEASITCFDLSVGMVRRAIRRLRSNLPNFLVADLSRLPFADGSFDCVTCGYVLEHLPDPRLGLTELARVLMPGGRMLLLTTEDNFGGALTSALWRCRTYNRAELQAVCHEVGLRWKQELWFTAMHRFLRAGGICVEIEKAS
jgi:ubiquinone/menaquinone biosynthesis C-methylase UbiE